MTTTNPVASETSSAACTVCPPSVHYGPRSADDDGEQESANPALRLLSPRQQQALEWLVNGGTVAEAAELVGVTRRTVSRWIHENPDFNHLYTQWQDQVRTGVEGRILGLADEAVENLIAAVRGQRDVKVSQFVLKLLGIGARSRRRR
jgi:hypothetical protein